MSQIRNNVSTFEPAPSDEIVAADRSFATNQLVVSGFDCGMSNGCTSLGRTWLSVHDEEWWSGDDNWRAPVEFSKNRIDLTDPG